MAQIYNTYETAFPDFRVTIEDTVRYTFTGTHNGPLGAIPASGNSLTESAIVIFRLAGGKVAEGRWAWDRVSMQQQIGALPRTSGQAAS
jgi:predicted ester cyclase